mmetsp:Transcript_11740/g.17637  ORF Transcript_11740/g.17637 Transcript_11740/m.17637 type:complete len:88 (+) Transcript_11740:19-282(+)
MLKSALPIRSSQKEYSTMSVKVVGMKLWDIFPVDDFSDAFSKKLMLQQKFESPIYFRRITIASKRLFCTTQNFHEVFLEIHKFPTIL